MQQVEHVEVSLSWNLATLNARFQMCTLSLCHIIFWLCVSCVLGGVAVQDASPHGADYSPLSNHAAADPQHSSRLPIAATALHDTAAAVNRIADKLAGLVVGSVGTDPGAADVSVNDAASAEGSNEGSEGTMNRYGVQTCAPRPLSWCSAKLICLFCTSQSAEPPACCHTIPAALCPGTLSICLVIVAGFAQVCFVRRCFT